MDEIDDRRGSGRVFIMTSATLEIAGQTVQATAMDLSVSGISVWAPEGITPAGPFKIKFEIDEAGPVEVVGTLARTFDSDGGSVWGIQFRNVDPALASRIEAYVTSLD